MVFNDSRLEITQLLCPVQEIRSLTVTVGKDHRQDPGYLMSDHGQHGPEWGFRVPGTAMPKQYSVPMISSCLLCLSGKSVFSGDDL